MKIVFLLCFVLSSMSLSLAQGVDGLGAKVAVATIIRGEVDLLVLGKTIKLKKDDWVKEGSVIKTAEKSFIRLVFIDKSQMNIGPNSEMKIVRFTGQESGIIDLVKGKVRSQVTKDYLQMKDKDKSKMFIKTPNAVMGIRGTDFIIATNGKDTSAVLFEGSVVFAKNSDFRDNSANNLEDVVNSGGVRMFPGEFSVMDHQRNRPTEPAILNIGQREVLEKHGHFDSERHPSNSQETKEQTRSIVPTGLDGTTVSNQSDVIKDEVGSQATRSSASEVKTEFTQSSKVPEGYIDGDKVKPANGSFVHLESSTIIPPGPGSVLDKNTNSYIPGPGQGVVNSYGEYTPPKNVEITTDGKMMVAFKYDNGEVKVQEIEKLKPVLNPIGVSLANIGEVIKQNPGMIALGGPITNDILNAKFVPNGLNDVNNLKQNNSGSSTQVESQVSTKSHVIIIGN
jgi:hypothetical protein